MILKLDSYKCWEIDEKDFPVSGSVEEKIKFILGYAILAPSTFNSQPWKCKLINNKLEIYLDKGRITKKSDKTERFAHISMGAFIQNLLVAANHFGLISITEFSSKSNSKLKLIATVKFSQGEKIKNNQFSAIKKRTTNRSLSKNKQIESKVLKEIKSFQDKDIEIKIFDAKHKKDIVSISLTGDFNIWTDIDFRKEHVGWVRNNLTRKYDGMPGFGVNANLVISFLAKPVILSPIFPKFQAKKNKKAIESTNTFAVINSSDESQSWIRVGMLFEKISLTLTSYKISVSPMGQFIEDESARNDLKELVKPGKDFTPQIFFRIGFSTLHVPHSPRFPVDKILI